MPNMPQLPVPIPADQKQVDGDVDTAPVYQTHRGKKPTSRDVGQPPPEVAPMEGWGIQDTSS